MPHVDCQGAQVAYTVDGSGRPLVLVHGTGGDAESNWGSFVERFGREWTVIRPDYSGSGATKDDGRPLTADYLTTQIIAAADAAGAKTFHLLGFSLGAALAAKIAGDHPDRVRSLILLAGFSSSADARAKLQFELWRDLIKTDRQAMARLILLTGFSPDALVALGADGLSQAVNDTVAGTDWEGMARQVELDLSIDVTESVARITAPSLIIGCTHDHMVPPSHARALAAAIPTARYTELETGHLAPMEQPETFAELVTTFLRDQER
ncbi:2-hydroxymuconic semialdehyde hydrolase (plasmid) [Roseomonas mucosa]|uniref:alpha/beta fold hydrolase n=1 Tax=Roseomonas mucosa TaxID=207340 RepID=UPI00220110AE|nr:alpha/beta hydrolase [Roseomonas mucosa]QDJ11587.1 2-hydroxymuconic semialdehyde hydrolase [Roseomonas mucosa]